MSVNAQPLLDEAAGVPLFLSRCGPRTLNGLVFALPPGARFVAVRVTDDQGAPDHWLVFSTARAQAWQAEALSAREGQRRLALWLRLRHPGEVRACPEWAGLLGVSRAA